MVYVWCVNLSLSGLRKSEPSDESLDPPNNADGMGVPVHILSLIPTSKKYVYVSWHDIIGLVKIWDPNQCVCVYRTHLDPQV